MKLHEKKSDKVAVVGMYPLTRDMCPFEDGAIEIWGCNDIYNYVPRVDVIFQIHNRVRIEEYPRDSEHIEWLKKANRPVYMAKPFKDFPKALVLPWRELVQEYGDYFTNGVSWMLALAIYMEYKEIQIYGVEMANSTEFALQKPSVTYFIGLARGKGIKVYQPKESTLMRSPFLYGIENEDKWIRTTNEKLVEYMNKARLADDAYLKARDEKNYIKGRLEAYDEMRTL